MSRRIGIFGGTFDPVHLGHVATLVALSEAHFLDHVYIIPTNINPHKEAALQPASSTHRLQMLKKAFKEVPRCSILTLEINSANPSYTIDTVHELRKKNILMPNDANFLLIGQDSLENLDSWKNIHELIRLTPPIIAKRSGVSLEGKWLNDPELKISIEQGVTQTPLMDITATDVRYRLKSGLYCGHLLDKTVLNYIQKHQLYHEYNPC